MNKKVLALKAVCRNSRNEFTSCHVQNTNLEVIYPVGKIVKTSKFLPMWLASTGNIGKGDSRRVCVGTSYDALLLVECDLKHLTINVPFIGGLYYSLDSTEKLPSLKQIIKIIEDKFKHTFLNREIPAYYDVYLGCAQATSISERIMISKTKDISDCLLTLKTCPQFGTSKLKVLEVIPAGVDINFYLEVTVKKKYDCPVLTPSMVTMLIPKKDLKLLNVSED